MSKTTRTLAMGLVILLSACGGGSGGAGSTSTPTSNSGASSSGAPASGASLPATTAVTDASAVPVGPASNAVPITVSNAGGNVNMPLVSVTICTPGTQAGGNCTTVNNILVDTQSYGLRVFAAAIPNTLASLVQQTVSPSREPIAECGNFGTGYTWGTVRTADIGIGDEVMENVPINVLTDSTLTAQVPSLCKNYGSYMSDSSLMWANGILGIGPQTTDCGSNCANSIIAGQYYGIDGATASPVAVPTSQQVANPVPFITNTKDTNGVIVEMNQVSDAGAATATGVLVFGIDTETNNALAGTGATLLGVDGASNLSASYNGGAAIAGFLDSGSNAMFFSDPTLTQNADQFYTPSSTLPRSATLTGYGTTGGSATVGFNIANANALFATASEAFNNLAGSNAGTGIAGQFDMGMPFFYGRHVFVGVSGMSSAGGGKGPYFAYVSQ